MNKLRNLLLMSWLFTLLIICLHLAQVEAVDTDSIDPSWQPVNIHINELGLKGG